MKIYGNDVDLEIERVCLTLSNMLKEYQLKHSTDEVINQVYDNSSDGATCDLSSKIDVDPLIKFDAFVTTITSIENMKSELDIYLEESLLCRTTDFDILAWWKTNGIKYSTLKDC